MLYFNEICEKLNLNHDHDFNRKFHPTLQNALHYDLKRLAIWGALKNVKVNDQWTVKWADFTADWIRPGNDLSTVKEFLIMKGVRGREEEGTNQEEETSSQLSLDITSRDGDDDLFDEPPPLSTSSRNILPYNFQSYLDRLDQELYERTPTPSNVSSSPRHASSALPLAINSISYPNLGNHSAPTSAPNTRTAAISPAIAAITEFTKQKMQARKKASDITAEIRKLGLEMGSLLGSRHSSNFNELKARLKKLADEEAKMKKDIAGLDLEISMAYLKLDCVVLGVE